MHSHAEGFFPVFHLHAHDFDGFTHAVVFFCGFVNSEAVSFTHGWIVGSALLLMLTHRLGDCKFIPSMVCVISFGDFIVQNGLLFPTSLVICMLMCFGAVGFFFLLELCLLLCLGLCNSLGSLFPV